MAIQQAMRNLLILIILAASCQGFAQDPDPDLFQTWYLYRILESDASEIFEISEIEPPITPIVTISENLNINGEGACNSFMGIYSYETPNVLRTTSFSNTTDNCGIQIHNFFEQDFFAFMNGDGDNLWFQITPDSEGLTLHLSNQIFGWAIFKNYPLSISDFYLNEIKIHPNPSSSQIFIKSEKYPVTKIELYNFLGMNIQTQNDKVAAMDISNVSSGIYLLKIHTDYGATIRKIVKK